MSTGNLHGNKTLDSCNGWRNSEIFKQCHLQKNQKEKTQRKQQNTPEAPLVTAVLYRVAFALLFV